MGVGSGGCTEGAALGKSNCVEHIRRGDNFGAMPFHGTAQSASCMLPHAPSSSSSAATEEEAGKSHRSRASGRTTCSVETRGGGHTASDEMSPSLQSLPLFPSLELHVLRTLALPLVS
jgi:hypothetical protein